jgi:hypothetical protein
MQKVAFTAIKRKTGAKGIEPRTRGLVALQDSHPLRPYTYVHALSLTYLIECSNGFKAHT